MTNLTRARDELTSASASLSVAEPNNNDLYDALCNVEQARTELIKCLEEWHAEHPTREGL